MGEPILVGLTGRAGAGKDTVAELLAPFYTRLAFADALKRAAYASDPLIRTGTGPRTDRLSFLVDTYGWDAVKREFTDARRYLQRYGVALRDEVPGVWVGIVRAQIDNLRAVGSYAVVTDVRFPDEVDMIRDEGGIVVRVVRPGMPSLAGPLGGHASETNVDTLRVDVDIENSGTLDDLARKVSEVLGIPLPATAAA